MCRLFANVIEFTMGSVIFYVKYDKNCLFDKYRTARIYIATKKFLNLSQFCK